MIADQLKGAHRQTFLKQRVEELGRIYSRAHKRLREKLQSASLSDFQRYRTKALLLQVNEEIEKLHKEARKWAKGTQHVAYKEGVEQAQEWIRNQGGAANSVDMGNRLHKRAINGLVDDVTLDLVQANISMRTNIQRYIKTTQQAVIEDREISQRIAEGLVEGETRRQTSKAIYEDFRRNMEEGQLITINGRNYQPDKYARMVARTRTREATTFGTYNTAIDYGMDLVQISVHDNPAPICTEYHGRVFSISGNHPDFPPVEALPPYHPNCKHVVVPVTEEALKEDGNYNQVKKFSNTASSEGVTDWESFQKKIQTPEPKYTTPTERKVQKKIGTREHIEGAYWGPNQRTEQIMKDLKVDRDTANSYRKAIHEFTGDSYRDIRKAQIGDHERIDKKLKEYGQLVDDYVERAPSFDGTVFRGLDIDSPSVQRQMLKLKAGDVMDMKGASSWTSDIDIANEFTMSDESPGNLRVLLQSDKIIRSGASVTHLTSVTHREEEVLVSSRARFKILNSEVFEEDDDEGNLGKTLVLRVEEV